MERTNAVAPDCRPLRRFHDVLHFLEESLALLEVGNHGMFARYVAGRHGDRLRSFLTDVQGEGTKFADETRRILISRGGRPLARAGAADVELRLARPGDCVVHALDSAGRRIGKIPSGAEDGVLRFRVSTLGPDGLACQFCEVARK